MILNQNEVGSFAGSAIDGKNYTMEGCSNAT